MGYQGRSPWLEAGTAGDPAGSGGRIISHRKHSGLLWIATNPFQAVLVLNMVFDSELTAKRKLQHNQQRDMLQIGARSTPRAAYATV